jgi:hypothetical protein
MDFLNLQTTEMRAPCFSAATAQQRGVWLSLQLFCVATENLGVIEGCADWSERDWLLTAGIQKNEAAEKSPLWHFEGPDLHVWNYPFAAQAKVDAGRVGGRKGGRPPKNNPAVNPAGNPAENPPLNPAGNPKGKDKDKGNKKEGQEQAASVAADDLDPIRSTPSTESTDPSEAEKEIGEACWLGIETDAARRLINASLGRPPSRAFTGQELHALGTYAQQNDGQISIPQFTVLQHYLMAPPRYDSRDQAALDAVPEGSLLRKRKRYAGNVIEDLPNQLDYATSWHSEPQKKERRRAVHPMEAVPDFDWRTRATVLAPSYGWDASVLAEIGWEDLSPDHKEIIWTNRP